MATHPDDLAGVPLFDSIIEKKQAELLQETQQKLSKINSTNIPTLNQRLDTIQAEQFASPVETLDIPTLEDRLRSTQEPFLGQPDLSSNTTRPIGLAYAANIPASVVKGLGMLGNMTASAPDTVINIYKNLGITTAVDGLLKNSYPEYSAQIETAGIGIAAAAKTISVFGDAAEEGSALVANSIETEILAEDLGKAYDDNDGAVDVLLALTSTIVDNPAALPEVIASSLPIMFALAQEGGLLALTFTGMTGQRIDDATENYIKANGVNPEGEAYNIILMGAVASTAIETVESRFLLGKSAKIQSATSKKLAALGKIPGINTAVKTLEGGAAEFFQEGSAEYINQITGRGDFTLEGLLSDEVVRPSVVAASIGAGAGAGIAGGVQILPDTGKAAKKGVQAVSDKVEKLVTVDARKRLQKAKDDGDNLAIVRIGLEKNITTLKDDTERQKYLKFLSSKITKAFDAIDALPEGDERSKLIDETVTISAQLDATIAAFVQSTKETSTVSAEQTIQNSESTAEELIEAINSVIDDAQQGITIQPNTVETIKGSSQFNDLTDEQKETVNLIDETIQTEKKARKVNPNKTLQDVAQDIQEGNATDRFIGLEQHRKNVANAIQFKDKKKAAKSLTQLIALRQAILSKLKNPAVDPATGKQFKQGKHSAGFVTQLSSEIEAITATINLLDSNITKAFGESTLTEAQQTTPTIEVFGGAATRKPTTDTTEKPKKGPAQEAAENRGDVDLAQEELDSEIRADEDTQEEFINDNRDTETERLISLGIDPDEAFNNQVEEEVEIKVEKEVVTPPSEIDPTTSIENVEIPSKSAYVAKILQAKISKGSFIANKTYKAGIVEADNVLRAVQDIVKECKI